MQVTYHVYHVFLEISQESKYHLFDLLIENKKHSLEEILEISEMLNRVRKMFRKNDNIYYTLHQFLCNLGLKMFNYIRVQDPNLKDESIILQQNSKFCIGDEVFSEEDELTFGLRLHFLF